MSAIIPFPTISTSFASLPAAASVTSGTIANATDLGSGGTLMISNTTLWRPLNGKTVLASSAVKQSVTGVTTETTLATITVPANLMTANGIITVTSMWSCTNNANNKTPRIYFGGTGGTLYANPTLTTSAALQIMTFIRNRGATNSQVGFSAGITISFNNTSGSTLTSAIDTTQSQTIVFTGQLATSTDTLSLESYTIELTIP